MGLWFEAMHRVESMLERIETYLGQDLSGDVSTRMTGYQKMAIIHGGLSRLNWTVYYNHNESAPPLISSMYTYFECVSSDSDIQTLLDSQSEYFEGFVVRENESILKIRFFQSQTPILGSRPLVLEFYCPVVVRRPGD
jgi:hypothetical protein